MATHNKRNRDYLCWKGPIRPLGQPLPFTESGAETVVSEVVTVAVVLMAMLTLMETVSGVVVDDGGDRGDGGGEDGT